MLNAFLGRRGCRCVLSPTVAEEARRVIDRVLMRIARSLTGAHREAGFACMPVEIKDMIYECTDRGNQLLSRMTQVGLDPSQVSSYRARADSMGEDIMVMYRAASAVRAAAAARSGVESRPGAAAGRGADLAQLARFAAREPGKNEADKRILAEAAAIRDILGVSGSLCIPSYDEGFFAPMRLHGGGVSRPVVDMIRKRFGITCGSPRDIWSLPGERRLTPLAGIVIFRTRAKRSTVSAAPVPARPGDKLHGPCAPGPLATSVPMMPPSVTWGGVGQLGCGRRVRRRPCRSLPRRQSRPPRSLPPHARRRGLGGCTFGSTHAPAAPCASRQPPRSGCRQRPECARKRPAGRPAFL